MIRNSGMTGRARNESVPNGASSGQPSACAARLTVFELAADLIGVVEREQTGDGKRQDRLHLAARGGDETAAVLGQGTRTHQHIAGIGPRDDQVVRIVRDRRAQGAVVRQPETADQSQADPARGPVPFDAGDQDDVALRVKRPEAIDPADAARRAPGDDLIGDDLDHRTGLRRRAAGGMPASSSGARWTVFSRSSRGAGP